MNPLQASGADLARFGNEDDDGDALLVEVIPVHDTDSVADLLEQWVGSRAPHVAVPLDAVRDYFGDEVAFHFGWIEFYLRALALPAALGFVIVLVQLFDSIDNPLLPIWALLLCLWSACARMCSVTNAGGALCSRAVRALPFSERHREAVATREHVACGEVAVGGAHRLCTCSLRRTLRAAWANAGLTARACARPGRAHRLHPASQSESGHRRNLLHLVPASACLAPRASCKQLRSLTYARARIVVAGRGVLDGRRRHRVASRRRRHLAA
jgi:hypothetical protein